MSNQEPPTGASGRQFRVTPAKRKQARMIQTTLDMFRKTPEEVVRERHAPDFVKPHDELSEKQKEQHAKLNMLWVAFFQDNGIPLSAMNSRSFEVMIEAIAQYGPGFVCPSQEELRGPLFEEVMKRVDELREKHEKAWEHHGCTLMVDSYSDSWRNLHLLSFMVASVEGIFFLGSADASYQADDSDSLADLIEDKIEGIGRDKVVQVVTNNNRNLKAACRLLIQRIPTLFWTPCAFQCLDLMLKDIGKLEDIKKHIQLAKRVTSFIYRHGRLLSAICNKIGKKELVAPATTLYSTSFLTLERMYRHRDILKCLFTNEDWVRSKLSSTKSGANVQEILLSPTFWNGVEDCIKASGPILDVLRMVYGAEKPTMIEVFSYIDLAKKKINDSLASNPGLLKKVMGIVDQRWAAWAEQVDQNLYGASLFLNPNKFYDIKENDDAYASTLRGMFNDAIEKLIADDDDLIAKVSDQADEYEGSESCFGKKLPILQRKKKNPNHWWSAYGGSASELQKVARRIVGLYCSASGYDRNWTMFDCINTANLNQSERKRLEDYAYIQYNQNMARRSERHHSEGSNFDPLIIDDLEMEHDWVGMYAELYNRDNLTWQLVEEVTDGSYTRKDHYGPRRDYCEEMTNSGQGSFASRLGDETDSDTEGDDDSFVVDDEDVENDYGQNDPPTPSHQSVGSSSIKEHMVDPFDMDDFLRDL